ncbi:ATP-binding protein [Thermosipho ferrireducens]|uniref:ATP-binding protein n=1 Tax=Thermosipho ferrireducens TaxID=2571116 RepID=A0ABX7S9V5_9BACT|nr:ATP-binding protein [Thermosipho ferrireducens]QTA38507.1 ATP-binding protein [Thermosipho ferrireducens]
MGHLKAHTEIFDEGLLLGYISKVTQNYALLNTPHYYQLTRYHYNGEDYHGGLLNSYVLIEGDNYGFLGQIFEIEFLEKERKEITSTSFELNKETALNPRIKISLLMAFDYLTKKLKRISTDFPNIGARVFLAKGDVVKSFLENLNEENTRISEKEKIKFCLGNVLGKKDVNIKLTTKQIFSRHCAIVGTTGSGKSWTAAKLIDLLIAENKKIILIDPTGEYTNAFDSEEIKKDYDADIFRLGIDSIIDYHKMQLEDLYLMLTPSEGIQLPKLNEAVRSLKLVKIANAAKDNSEQYGISEEIIRIINSFIGEDKKGLLKKKGKNREDYETLLLKFNKEVSENNLNCVNIFLLSHQIKEECIWETNKQNNNLFGDYDEKTYGQCLPMILRLNNITNQEIFEKLFVGESAEARDVLKYIENFVVNQEKKVLVINLEEVITEFNMKELVVELIGRKILELARKNGIKDGSVFVFVDEAHNFLKKEKENEMRKYRLNSFEILAKESRKKGVFLCIITQRPGDIPEGVLSQFGTFIIHNLTNSNDIERVKNVLEKSGTIMGLLPYLNEGEAIISSVNIPLILPMKIHEPRVKPDSDVPM